MKPEASFTEGIERERRLAAWAAMPDGQKTRLCAANGCRYCIADLAGEERPA